MNSKPSARPGSTRPRYALWVFGAFAAVALFFLIAEHRAHLFGAWPLLLLALCPLLHFFHHRGGGHHGSGNNPPDGARKNHPHH